MYVKHMAQSGYSVNTTSHPSLPSSAMIYLLAASLVSCAGLWGHLQVSAGQLPTYAGIAWLSLPIQLSVKKSCIS